MSESLAVREISKSFGAVQALRNVGFSVREGEIHAILGENGAGKSTLVRIISGEVKPDSGVVILNGRQIEIRDPKHAQSLGIRMVHQELSVFENLTVAENVFPRHGFKTRLGLINKRELVERAKEKLALFGLEIHPREKLVNLSLAEQQVVEILRSISLQPKIVILDEPTSGLKSTEVENLFRILKKLREGKITVLYISHRIQEILDISDRITVLKDGAYVATVDTPQVGESELITMMIGREIDGLYARGAPSQGGRGEVFWRLANVGKKNSIDQVNLEIASNEIVGVFGLEGSGTNELSRLMFGLDRCDRGTMELDGKPVQGVNPGALLKQGVVYLSRSRKTAGLFFDMEAYENIGCPILGRFARVGFLDYRRLQEFAAESIKRFEILIPSVHTKPKYLSGGNQQKLMLSICLGTRPRCIIINEPTRGIDVGAKVEVHRLIRDLVRGGTSVIIFSSELPELVSLCDRVVVMKNKRISGELAGDQITEEAIMTYAAGGR